MAVTGPTGTSGADAPAPAGRLRRRVIGIARRPFDPAALGWTKLEYRRGDVRDAEALGAAFEGADVVVHLAFLIVGGGAGDDARDQRRGHPQRLPRGGRGPGRERFVYASSIAAYGFHRDNPIGMDEDWATRPADRLFYAREKAELEHLLHREAAEHPGTALYLLRPRSSWAPTRSAARSASLPRWRPLVRGAGARCGGSPGCRSWCRTSPSSSSTRRTWPRRCACASSAPVRPVPTTSPRTTSSPAPTWPASSGSGAVGSRPVPSPAAARAGREAAVPAVGGAVGRGREPPGDHGHDQGADPARLATPAHRDRIVALDARG